MAVAYQEVDITCTTGGAATVYSGIVDGRIVGIYYKPASPGNLATGADLTITTETTGQSVLVKANAGTSNAWFFPRVTLCRGSDGAEVAFYEQIWCARERIQVVIAEGGNATTGKIGFLVETFPAQ